MDKELKNMLMELSRKESLAKQKELADQLHVPFQWPSVEEQVVGKGHIGDYKRGRAKNFRLMYHIPGAQMPNGLNMPGFVCHPEMAIAAAKELLRLAGITGEDE